MSGFYQVIFFGSADERRADIQGALKVRVSNLGLPLNAITFFDPADANARNRSLPTLGIYLGGEPAGGATDLLRELLSESQIIIPVVSNLARVPNEVTAELLAVNALELNNGGAGLDRLASLVLETFRLLLTRPLFS